MNNRVITIVRNDLVNKILKSEETLERLLNGKDYEVDNQLKKIDKVLSEIVTLENKLHKLDSYLIKEKKD
jgi:phage shock protein A